MRDTLYSYYLKYGYSPHGLVAISGAEGWEARRAEGAVAYLERGRNWIASEPLAPERDLAGVAAEFLAYAQSRGRRAAFLPVTERFARVAVGLGLDCVPIGMAPYFDLKSWSSSGERGRKTRKERRRAVAAGVTVECAPARLLRSEIDEVSRSWARTRRTVPFSWVFSSDIFNFPECRLNYVARADGGKIVAVLSAAPLPARNGYYFKDLHRRPDAPGGTSDHLITTALEHLRARGDGLATPGAVPLYGVARADALLRGNHRLLLRFFHQIRRCGEPLYPFRGLFQFKDRLAPTWWEHEYAVGAPGCFALLRAGWAAVSASAPGGVLKAVWMCSWRCQPNQGCRSGGLKVFRNRSYQLGV